MISQQESLSNPFPGLRPFEMEEYHLFFGREGHSHELLKRLQANRFVAVVGTSGSGKSSLVRAGLLPALFGGFMTSAGSSWRVAIFRPGNDPTGNLARALRSPEVFGAADGQDADLLISNTEITLRRSSLGLIEAVRHARMQPHENLLIVVDQFEELFRIDQAKGKNQSEDEATAFVKVLIEVIQQTELPIYVILTMRSDYLGECARFRDLPEAINKSQYLIPRMTDDERREAITGPVAVEGGQITLPLVNRLLNDVGDSPDQLPILQHALMRTWDYWMQSPDAATPIDIPHYEQIGGISNALSMDADKAFEELSESQKRVAENVFKRLTEKGPDNREIRHPTSIRELSEISGAGKDEILAIIETFRKSGRSFLTLLESSSSGPGTADGITEDTLVDISHESLIRVWDRLTEWVDEEALSARTYRRLAERAIEYGEGKGELVREPALQFALDWRERHKPTKAWATRYHPEFEKAMAFLDESHAAREAEVADKERRQKEQFELEQRKQLAEDRAEQAQALASEQSRAARSLRKLVVALVVMFLLAAGAAVSAVSQGAEASKARKLAEERLNLATQQTELAIEARREADTQAILAQVESEKASKQADLARQQYLEAEKAKSQLVISQRKAEEEHRRAEQQAKAVGDIRLQVLNKLGGLYREAISLSKAYEKEEQAISKFNEILGVYTENGVHSGQITTLLSLAELYTEAEDTAQRTKAIPHYRKALKLFGPEDNSEKVLALLNLGDLLTGSTDIKEKREAADYYEQALALGIPDSQKQISTYRSLGDIYDKSKESADIRKAIGAYEKEFSLLEKRNSQSQSEDEDDSTLPAAALVKIGTNYSRLGREAQAQEYFDKARKLRRNADNPKPEANVIFQIGERFRELGDNQKASRYFDEAVKFSSDAGNKREKADTLRRIALLYSRGPDKNDALEYFQRALESYREIGDKRMEASIFTNLGNSYKALKQYQKALDYLNEAAEIYKTIGDKPRERSTSQAIEAVTTLVKGKPN